MEFKIDSLDFDFRVKRLNVIEVLAIRANLASDNIEETTRLFNSILERLEVRIEDKWIPVKLKNLDNLTPACLDADIRAVKELIDFFIKDYLKQVFMKSNESKN